MLDVYVLEDDVGWKKLIDKYVKAQKNLAAAQVKHLIVLVFLLFVFRM